MASPVSSTRDFVDSRGPPIVGVGVGGVVREGGGWAVRGRGVQGEAAARVEEPGLCGGLRRPGGEVAPCIGSGDVDADGARTPAACPLRHVLFEPVPGLPRGDREALGDGVDVGPRTDRHGHVDTAFVQALILMDGLLEEDVLPTPEEQHGHLDSIEGNAVLHRCPERIALVGPGDPVGVPRGPAAEKGRCGRDERQLVENGADPPSVPSRLQHDLEGSTVFLVDHLVAPPEEVEPERAGSPDVLAEVVGPDGDDRGGQLGRRVRQERPLSVTQVGRAERGEGAGEPGLAEHPGDDIVTVVFLVPHGIECPSRAEGAAAAHEEGVVAAGGEDPRQGQGQGQVPAVGPPNEQRPDGVRSRLIEIRGELDPVAHRHPDAAADGVVGRDRREAEQAGGKTVCGAAHGRTEPGRGG